MRPSGSGRGWWPGGEPLTGDQVDALAASLRRLFVAPLGLTLPGNRGFDRNPAGSVEDQARHVTRLLG